MSQRPVCGIHRFDKHRVCNDSRTVSTKHSSELQQRLQQREEQDKALFGTSPVLSPSILSSSPVSIPPPPSPVLNSFPPPPLLLSGSAGLANSASYTPWKTPSATAFEPGK